MPVARVRGTMDHVRGAWSEDEAAEFLQSTAIPIRLTTRRPDGSLWTVALWYRYRGGALECATAADAALVRYLRNEDGVAFDVSTNHPPYRGVRGHGRATVSADADKAVLRDLLERYLDGTDSDLARTLLDEERAEVRIRVHPREVYTWDYTERMRGVGDQ